MDQLSKLSPTVLALLLVAVGAALGYGAFVASKVPDDSDLPGDVAHASKGEAFDIKEHLVPGKFVIFDFYADWCPPCRALDPQLRLLASKRPDVAIRKVDIVDWTSAVVQQYGVTALPYMRVYGTKGEMLGDGDEAYRVIAEVIGADVR